MRGRVQGEMREAFIWDGRKHIKKIRMVHKERKTYVRGRGQRARSMPFDLLQTP